MSKLRVAACLLFAVIAFSGCTTPQEKLLAWAQAQNAEISTIDAQPFALQVVAPRNLPMGGRLTIFIEGDGHAWATRSQPSLDPSPHRFSTVALAINPGHRGVYLARPCQFVMSSTCHKEVWTDARFSQAVVDAIQSAINILKARYHASSIELIGYSGGGAITLLVAEQRDDVIQIQTICGNVDPQAWVQLNNLSPLKGSLDPLENATRLASIPQRHFVASNDKVIPLKLTEDFIKKIQPQCAQVVSLVGDHVSALNALTSESLSIPIVCK